MATEGSSSAGYTAVAEAVHRHGATIFARLFHPEVMDGQRGMAPRAVAPSDEPQEQFKDVPEALSTAATNAQSRSSARYFSKSLRAV
jgi:2,4-dienoyl-CoA reductase-like NADH-dependent reductase (Old Yellow Enzyme family)